jgi:hypothetical protein
VRLHTLYQDKGGHFTIVSIESGDLSATQVEGILPRKTFVDEMLVVGDYVFISATIKRFSFIFSINWKTGGVNTFPIVVDKINAKKLGIMNMQVLENSNEMVVFIGSFVEKKRNEIFVQRFNEMGEKVETFHLTENIEKNLISVSASKLSEGSYIYTGTYATERTGQSEGLFFCRTNNNEIQSMEFYNFLDLENFLSYLSEKAQAKVEKKKKKKEEKGEEYHMSYSIALHDVIPVSDGYLFLGEAYYPTYRTEQYATTTTMNGMTTTQWHTRSVFDGFQYTHAVLGRFDAQGKLLWNEIFEMWPSYKPYMAKRFISIAEQDSNALNLVFASHNRIKSKSIDFGGHVLQEETSDEIQTSYEGDRVRSSFSNLDYWYGDYFIAYGSQKIKNNEEEDRDVKRRRVYFINKIRF